MAILAHRVQFLQRGLDDRYLSQQESLEIVDWCGFGAHAQSVSQNHFRESNPLCVIFRAFVWIAKTKGGFLFLRRGDFDSTDRLPLVPRESDSDG